MQNFLRQIRIEKETVIIAGSVTLYLLWLWFRITSFELQQMPSIILGQATIDGIDVVKRVNMTYLWIGASFILIAFVYLLLHALFSFTQISDQSKQAIMIPCGLAMMLTVADIFEIHSNRAIQLLFCIAGLQFMLSLLAARIRRIRFLGNSTVMGILCSTSILLLFLLKVVLNDKTFLHDNSVLVISGLFLFLVVLLVCVSLFSRQSLAQLFAYARHLSLIPLVCFIMIELVFSSKGHPVLLNYYPVWILALLGVILLVSMAVLKKTGRVLHSGHLLKIYFMPGVLAAFVLSVFYHPFPSPPSDFFELANPANAQLFIFGHGRIPIVDFMSSHMLSEQWTGIFYHLFHGYKGNYDFIVFQFAEYLLFYWVIYYFCMRLFRNAYYSFLFVLFFPFQEVFFTQYLYPALMIIVFVFNVGKYQTPRHYLFLFLALSFMLLWRVDLGIAAIAGTMLYLLLLLLSGTMKIRKDSFLKGFIYFSGFVFSTILLLVLIRPLDYLMAHLRNVLHYISANQSHGYSAVVWETNQHVYLFYFGIPLLSIASVFILILQLKTIKHDPNAGGQFLLHSSLFLFLITLFNFQRGIVRHGFLEGNEVFMTSMFYVAMSLLLVYFLKIKNKAIFLLCFAWLSFGIIILWSYFPKPKEKIAAEHFLHDNGYMDFSKKLPLVNFRQRVPTDKNTQELVAPQLNRFLKQHFKSDQTFFDFSNSPLLYYATQRKIPSYFCQSLQNITDVYLQKTQLKLLDTARVPVVVFANHPPNWFDAVDGVPNTLRYYELAEFIFRWYKPCSVLDGRSIWVSKHLIIEHEALDLDSMAAVTIVHEYKKAARLISDFYEREKYEGLISYTPINLNVENGNSNSILIPEDVKNSNGVWLQLIINATVPSEIRVAYESGDSVDVMASVMVQSGEAAYMIRLSNQHAWFDKAPEKLLFYSPEGISFERTIVYKQKD